MDKIDIIRWDTPVLTFVFIDDITGERYDITWATVYFTAKLTSRINDASDVTAQIQKIITTHIAPTEWTTEVDLTQTDTWVSWLYYWDLQIKYPDGTVTSTLKWSLEIIEDVTKS